MDADQPLAPEESLPLGRSRADVLGMLRAPVTADRLEPFVESNLCVASFMTS